MNTDKKLAYLILRLTLGVNILIHGVGRIGASHEKFVNETLSQFANSPVPTWSVIAFAHVLPFLEAIVGLLIALGIVTRYASVFGSLVMISLIIGMGTLQKWDIVGIQMIYVLFYFLLLFLREWNHYSLDKALGWNQR